MGMNNSEELPPVVSGSDWPGVGYFCTTRGGGRSQGSYASMNLGRRTKDDPADVRDNQRRLRLLLPADPLWLSQVHGVDVADADAVDESAPVTADAAVTIRPGRVLAILTADCLPVVIADRDGRALGAAHAGWRGLCHGVLEATMKALRERCPQSAGWRAWIGPGIGPEAFEVGDEVRQAFLERDPAAQAHFLPGVREGKWMADLPALATMRLRAQGVEDIEASGLCTYTRQDLFFSYRRLADSGRMATCAWLKQMP
ncbi:hypothetical protein EV686_10928 [Paracandidimonas soli]|uniref:Purine nucleoside phosphorylase n=2 Tax=Paracandidimonas soli TaxID=1917182 RepID=A0A4R3UUS9_9BURK|nr:hypothetical protein EV686_10928 [Paracandidimonas soli]